MGGTVIEIKNALLYTDNDYVFKPFVEKFNLVRDKGGYYKIFGKSVINSLYGGLALKDKNLMHYITSSDDEFNNILTNNDIESFHKINNIYIIFIHINYKSKHFFNNKKISDTKRNVSYASSIASKARIKLYKALLEVIDDGGRLLYVDTDSIFAAYNINNKSLETKSFKWLKFFDDAVFISPKTYGLMYNDKEEIKIKGVTTPEIDFKNLKKKFYENSSISFSEQLIFSKYDFNLKQLYIEKNISLSAYDKRIFSKNKKETFPIKKNIC